MRNAQLTRSGAFTLFELLVAITIVALLASLVMPVIKTARLAADDVSCLSGLRQIGIAAQSYAADNRRHFPMASMKTSHTPNAAGIYPTNTWYRSLAPYLDDLKGTVVGGTRVIDAIGCPTFRKTGTAFTYLTWSWNGYGNNSNPWQGGDRTQDLHTTYSPNNMSDSHYQTITGSVIRSPLLPTITWSQNRIFAGDCNDGLLQANGSQRNKDLASLAINSLFWKADPIRHRGSANYVYFDGHAGRATRIAAYWGLIDPEKGQ